MSKSTAAPSRNWWTAAKVYLTPRMLAMMALGFASGLPFMMFFSKLSRWLTDAGIDKSTIGFFYFISLAYGLKFLWAPVVDRARIPGLTGWLGQRRSWMFLAIIGTIIGMLTMSLANPDPNITGSLLPIVIGGFILTYSGATLDISVDAWRIESADNDEQANMAAVYQLGYRFAIMAAGYFMIFADFGGWNWTYRLTGATMGLLLLVVLFVKEPAPDTRNVAAQSLRDSFDRYVIEPFTTFAKRFGLWMLPVLLLVCLYRLSDFTMGVMAQPLYADIGFSKTTVGLIQGTFGPWPLIVGAFVGGLFSVRLGMMRALFIGAVMTILVNASFAWLALQTDTNAWKLGTIIVLDNLIAGFVVTVFIAYMSSLVDRRYAATQYALLSSLYAFFCKILAGFSGVLYDGVGAFKFFVITAGYGLPAIAVLIIVWRYGPPSARGAKKEAQKEA